MDYLPSRKQEKKHKQTPSPKVIEAYNTGMGGVDIIDQVMSYYRSKSCTVKYSVRVMLHFLDLACANAWLEYRMDCKVCYVPTLDSVEFKLRVAKDLIGGNCVHECNPPSESDLEEEGVSSNGRKKTRPLPSHEVRTKCASHMPQVLEAYACRQRCRYPGCSERTRCSCQTCKVFLCLSSERYVTHSFTCLKKGSTNAQNFR